MDNQGGWGLTALRLTMGLVMAGHGIEKLTHRLGGGGLKRTAKGMEFMGLRPGRHHAIAAGVTELGAGIASILGIWMPAASAAVTGTQLVAIAKVNGKNGPWLTKGGYEYNATLLAVCFALAAAGPGKLALDGTLTRRRTGPAWAVAELAMGGAAAAGVLAALERRERLAAVGQPPDESPSSS